MWKSLACWSKFIPEYLINFQKCELLVAAADATCGSVAGFQWDTLQERGDSIFFSSWMPFWSGGGEDNWRVFWVKRDVSWLLLSFFYGDKDVPFFSGSTEHQGRHLCFRNMAQVPPERTGLEDGTMVERVVGECQTELEWEWGLEWSRTEVVPTLASYFGRGGLLRSWGEAFGRLYSCEGYSSCN